MPKYYASRVKWRSQAPEVLAAVKYIQSLPKGAVKYYPVPDGWTFHFFCDYIHRALDANTVILNNSKNGSVIVRVLI